MDINLFDFYLPEELIAQQPSDKRDHSRLLVIDKERRTYEDKMFYDIAGSDYDHTYLREKYAKYGYNLNRFYCECDSTLRKRMVEWVMTNYNG